MKQEEKSRMKLKGGWKKPLKKGGIRKAGPQVGALTSFKLRIDYVENFNV